MNYSNFAMLVSNCCSIRLYFAVRHSLTEVFSEQQYLDPCSHCSLSSTCSEIAFDILI